MTKDLPPGWFCAGQEDLTDLVGTEHLHGSIPAGETDAEREDREYAQAIRLRKRGGSDE